MCRSTVATVVSVDGSDAVVAFDGLHRRASALLVPDLVAGEAVLIGLGIVLGRVSAGDLAALRTLETPAADPDPDPYPKPDQKPLTTLKEQAR